MTAKLREMAVSLKEDLRILSDGIAHATDYHPPDMHRMNETGELARELRDYPRAK